MKLSMWKKPWTMKEGFLIGGGLVVIGLMVQLCFGAVPWSAIAWPLNGLLFGALLALTVIAFLMRKRIYVIRFLASYMAAIPVLVYAVVLTIVMGLTRQQSGLDMNSEGTWLNDMLAFWPFVLIYVLMAVILALVILRRLAHLSSWRRDIPFVMNHLGLFLAMTTATLGNADMQRLKMVAAVGVPEWRALAVNGTIQRLPMTIELKRFIMETYDDGSAKRYASEVLIRKASGETVETTIDVNRPVEIEGWKIYQYGYDTEMGAQSHISILELVSDPWLPFVYVGIYMMLGGAVCLFVFGGRRGKTNGEVIN